MLFCMVCKRQIVGILFLPCAHNKTCADCGKDLLQCPACGYQIQETIETSLLRWTCYQLLLWRTQRRLILLQHFVVVYFTILVYENAFHTSLLIKVSLRVFPQCVIRIILISITTYMSLSLHKKLKLCFYITYSTCSFK
jgi:hypothetical protein